MGRVDEISLSAFPPPLRINHVKSRKNCKQQSLSQGHKSKTASDKSLSSSSFRLSSIDFRKMWPLAAVLILQLLPSSMPNPIFVDNPSLAQFQSGRNIRNLPCIVRKSGRSGVCMFAIDCIKQNGTHLGTCIDRFYFGSCCSIKDDLYAPEISDNSIDQNTISHFIHDSTTLPTSSIFKLTTEKPNEKHPTASSFSEIHRNATQNIQSNKTDITRIESTTKPSKVTITKRPVIQTTHKNSHFVIRTTHKPNVNGSKPSSSPTVKPFVYNTTKVSTTAPSKAPFSKPHRFKTTTAAPVLTTMKTPLQDQRNETTTPPSKFVTFQIVETTASPTDSTVFEDFPTTTQRPLTRFNQTRPSHVPITPPILDLQTTTKQPSKTTTTTTKRPKPLITRRPVTVTKKPFKKPTTSKPISTISSSTQKPIALDISTMPNIVLDKRPSPTKPSSTKPSPTKPSPTKPSPTKPSPTKPSPTKPSTLQHSTTVKMNTTSAPRPRPRPTADIIKVPKPEIIKIETSTTISMSQHPTSKPLTTARPTTQSSSTTLKVPSLSTTSSTTSTTPKPTRRTPTKPSTPSSTTTITFTTEKPKVPSTSSTTHKPSFVTWTNLDAEPSSITVSEDNWQPKPPVAEDWVPVPTIAPEILNKTEYEIASPNESSSEKVIISVSSSVSEISGSTSSTKPQTDEPIQKTTETPLPSSSPTTLSSTSSTTTLPIKVSVTPKPTSSPSTTMTLPSTTTHAPVATKATTPSTTTTTTTRTTSTTTTPSPSTHESPSTESATTEVYSSTENILGTTTIDDVNLPTDSSSTPSPSNSLEGLDYRQVCGRRMFPEPRIVGGSNAAFGRWPWQISLRQWRTSTYLHKCGAALLNENWAITAAHCVDNVPPSDLLLRLGEYDLAEEEEPYGYQERRVQIVASHPQFDARTFEYDLALLRFYEPVTFQPNIIPVCVPNSDEDFIGKTAFVTGWGRLYEDGPLPSVLQEVAVPVINNTLCESMYRTAGYIEHIPHIFICAGWKKGGYDSCEGDSGGPMVLQREEDKRFQLGGVISWGIGCAEANQPGVYTRISEFRDWINQILQF